MDPAALQVLHHVLEARKGGSGDTVSLPGVDLRGAQLLRADLVGCDLSGAGLDHAQLAGAHFARATLQTTLLRWTDLSGVDFTEADLRNADLSWARLEGASLAGADLRGASIEGVVGEPSTIAGARIDQAMVDRSALEDEDVVQLWKAGAVIEDIEAFDSNLIRNACDDAHVEAAGEVGPSNRAITDLEITARMQRAQEDDEVPPSARVSMDVLRAVEAAASIEPPAPISMRALKMTADVITPEIRMAPAWKKGDSVLGVTLADEIGKGNCGVVWRAVDGDGAEVAAKLFRTNRAGIGLSLPSYRRGVAVMNRLTGLGDETPGVVEVRCVSVNKLGFTMDAAANGSSVDLPALAWNVPSIVEWFDKLCRNVAAAHDAGALHRCIKPSNVLLNADLEPILTDFDMVDLPTVASEAHNAGGYAPYAAPEELLGQGTQSPTADIFSLGRMLHFLLIGEHPDAKIADVPQLEALRDQPAGLVRIIRKCCMRAPEARYQWVKELIADLENYEDYENVGYEGGPEANYLPYRVSSLGHQTTWLRGSKRPSRIHSSAPPPRRADVRTRRRRSEPAPDPAPLGLGRGAEKALGTFGALMILAAMLAIELADGTPPHRRLIQMQALSAVGGGLSSLLIPAAQSNARLWRLLLIAFFLITLYLLNVPSWFVQ